MNRVDDLTIFLRAVDRTRGAFGSVNRRISGFSRLARLATRAAAGIGGALITTLTAAAANGQQVVSELEAMARLLGTSTREADALFEIFREAAPTASIERIREATLTLQEGFFDARTETGPLFDLIRDFGANINLDLDDPRQQLAEFFRVVNQLGLESDRVGAIIANLGGDDARPFLPLARSAEDGARAVQLLQGDIENIANVMSGEAEQSISEYRESVNRLNRSWDNVSESAFLATTEGLTPFNNALATGLERLPEFLDFLQTTGTELNSFVTPFFEEVTTAANSYFDSIAAGIANLGRQAIPESVRNIFRLLLIDTPVAAFDRVSSLFRDATDAVGEYDDAILRLARDSQPRVIDVTLTANAELERTNRLYALGSQEADRLTGSLARLEQQRREEEAAARIESGENALSNLVSAGRSENLDSNTVFDPTVQLRNQRDSFIEFSNTIEDRARSITGGITSISQAFGLLFAENSNLSQLGTAEELYNRFADAIESRTDDIFNGISTVSTAFGQLAGAASNLVSEGSEQFERFKQISVAFAQVSAITAAINSARSASFSLNPFAAIAAYLDVGTTLLSGVAALRSISIGDSSTSLPGGSADSTGPANGPIGGVLQQESPQQQREVNVTIDFSGSGSNVFDEFVEEIVGNAIAQGLQQSS